MTCKDPFQVKLFCDSMILKECKGFYVMLVIFLAAQPHHQGVHPAGLRHSLHGILPRWAHLSRSEPSSFETMSSAMAGNSVNLEWESREGGSSAPPNKTSAKFLLTVLVICNDPAENKIESCSQSCLCHCVQSKQKHLTASFVHALSESWYISIH